MVRDGRLIRAAENLTWRAGAGSSPTPAYPPRPADRSGGEANLTAPGDFQGPLRCSPVAGPRVLSWPRPGGGRARRQRRSWNSPRWEGSKASLPFPRPAALWSRPAPGLRSATKSEDLAKGCPQLTQAGARPSASGSGFRPRKARCEPEDPPEATGKHSWERFSAVKG